MDAFLPFSCRLFALFLPPFLSTFASFFLPRSGITKVTYDIWGALRALLLDTGVSADPQTKLEWNYYVY